MNNLTHKNQDESSTVPVKIIHFVTGGFTGSTAVALALSKATQKNPRFESLLILREKKSTDKKRIAQLLAEGVALKLIPGWSHLRSIFALYKICRKYQPDILVTHGFSEHLWGRYAGLLAKVPHMVHVEHNSRERYTPARLWQARWLARFTDKIVGCSEGVRKRLLELKFPAEKTIAINNGIALDAFKNLPEFQSRIAGIVMPARFAKQKDHLTLIQAIALLREYKLYPPVIFAGAGKKKHKKKAKALVQHLELQDQIHFIGQCNNIPALLTQFQMCVLSTRYEGMPLALAEGMAAGCAVIGSKVPGVKEMIRDKEDGLLVTPESPIALAKAIAHCMHNPEVAAQLAASAHKRAFADFSLQNMHANYEQLYMSLMQQDQPAPVLSPVAVG